MARAMIREQASGIAGLTDRGSGIGPWQCWYISWVTLSDLLVRVLSGQQAVVGRPEGVDITSVVQRCGFALFRTHEERRADHHAGLRQVPAGVGNGLGQPEVGDLDRAIRLRMKLAGLMSRWIRPASWAAPTPLEASISACVASTTPRAPSPASRSPRLPPATYSRTR